MPSYTQRSVSACMEAEMDFMESIGAAVLPPVLTDIQAPHNKTSRCA